MVANAEKKYESGKLETGSEAYNELWRELMAGRGLHSSTCQLNLSRV